MSKKDRNDLPVPHCRSNVPDENGSLQRWALVELFGHQRIVGWVTVDPVDFPNSIRVDVPDLLEEGKVIRHGFTRYFGKAAFYSVTPISEQNVRDLLPHVDGHPARPLELGTDGW